MEDVQEVYHREFDEDTVLVCMDETSKQQTKETQTPLPARSARDCRLRIRAKRRRQPVYGVCSVARLAMGECDRPLNTARLGASDPRTDGHLIFLGKKIVLVMDNLNIHSLASLYEVFEPAEGGSRSAWKSTTRRSTVAG